MVGKGLTAMTMTDPIADMLTRLRNANQAYHEDVTMPYSKIKAGVAEILQQEGYITSWKVEDNVDAGRDHYRKLANTRHCVSPPGPGLTRRRRGLPHPRPSSSPDGR